MPTPNDVTDLTNAVNALTGAVNAKIPEIDQRLNLATQRIGNSYRPFWVDQANGDDAADGTETEPLQTLQEAMSRMVHGGRTDVSILGNYTLDGRLNLPFGGVLIRGHTGSEVLSFTGAQFTDGNGLNYSPSVLCSPLGTSLRLQDLTIELANDQGASDVNCAINQHTNSQIHFYKLAFSNVAASDQAIFNFGGGLLFTTGLVTSDAPLSGRWIRDIAAGTDPATVPFLIHNHGHTL